MLYEMNALECRFFSKVDASGDCWEWMGYVAPKGYGRFMCQGRSQMTHRVVWMLLVGSIPDGMQIDHRCKNRKCVNPDHLELVTPDENYRRGAGVLGGAHLRKTVCHNGHNLADSSYIHPATGKRQCRPCRLEYGNHYRERRRKAAKGVVPNV